VFVQVHFSGLPGATKKHLLAIKREIVEKTQDMTRRGQLILAGRYLSSIGGVWLLKVKNFEEAQRLAKEHPAVKSNLLSYRAYILVDTMGNLLKVLVTAANMSDGKAAIERLKTLPKVLFKRLKRLWADGGYRGLIPALQRPLLSLGPIHRSQVLQPAT